MKRIQPDFSTTLLSTVLLICGGCVDETTQNSLDRKKDLERESAHALAHDYEEVSGTYSTDPHRDTTPYIMDMELAVILVPRDGALVPAPSITGSLRMHRKESIQGSDNGYGFVVSNGVYDPNLLLLSFRIPSPAGDTAGINVNCHVNSPNLFCSWNPSLPGERFNFVLIRS